MRLGVVVLNYNGAVDTLACLASLTPQLGRDDQVMVVDNFSREEDRTTLVSAVEGLGDPRLELVLGRANLGFAGGNNLGLERLAAQGFEYALLLNNDTVLEPSALDSLLDGARRAGADLAGPKILYFDAPQVVWHGAGWYSPLRQGPFVPSHRRPDAGDTNTTEASFLTGCALLLSRRAHETLGPLDDGYFFYFEDWDYCYRAARRGLRVIYVPASRVLHKVSRASGGWSNAFSLYHQGRGRARFLRKHVAGWRNAGAVAYLLTVVTAMKAAQIAASPGPKLPRLGAWLRGCLGLPPSSLGAAVAAPDPDP